MTEYTREFHRLLSRNNLNKTDEWLVSRFINGLKDKLQGKMVLQPQYSLMNAINVAEWLKRQALSYPSYTYVALTFKHTPDVGKGILPIPKDKEPTLETTEIRSAVNNACALPTEMLPPSGIWPQVEYLPDAKGIRPCDGRSVHENNSIWFRHSADEE